MAARLRICLKQRDQLERTLNRQAVNIRNHLDRLDDTANSRQAQTRKEELEWLLLEVEIVEQMLKGQLRRVQGELPRASLYGLDFRVICLAFEGHRTNFMEPPLPLSYEVELLQIFNRHLQPDAVSSAGLNEDNTGSSYSGNKRSLVSRSEGHQAVKWLCHRAAELTRSISNDEYDQTGSVVDEDSEDESANAAAAQTATRNLMASSLAYIYDSFITILEACRIATAVGDSSWTDNMMKLLASGACTDEDMSSFHKPHACNETFFRFLARQSLELTVSPLA